MNLARLLVALSLLGAGWWLLSARPALGGRDGGGGPVGGRGIGLLPPRSELAGAPSARWARRSELRSLVVRNPTAGRLTLGRARRRLIAAEPGCSVLVVGPTQSRKTSGLAVPAVLEWEGPLLAASVKSDLARHTVDWRRARGEVWVYDPSGSTGLGSATWSPLSQAGTWSGARRVARSLTEVARSSAGSLTDGDFWYATAAKLLGPLLMAAAVSGRGMSDVVRWVDTQEVDEVAAALEMAVSAGTSGVAEALQALEASSGREARQKSAVYTTAETVVEPFADPAVARSCDALGAGGAGGGAVDPARLLDGDNTLYLCAPTHDQRRLRPLFATLVTQVIEAAYERAELRGAALDPRLLVVLDEAANVAPVAELDVLASTATGHGVQLVTVWQDLGQITARYGPRAGSVVNNHRAKVFLSGIADTQTLEHASQLIGDAEHPSVATTSDGRSNSSTTRSPVVRRLLPGDALRRVPPGGAVVVSGHLPPVRVALRPWQDDQDLRRRVEWSRRR
ncbi:MAG TPA: type IV secretory system conjugative DNA transfer family protein [Acidimicrobiales bacterium]|nr:type IV secretory system conjugative DNA transfer family protein [Acidimicrobiales bacterium]